VVFFYDINDKESRDFQQEYITLAEKMFGII